MTNSDGPYKLLVLTRRIKMLGIVETMSEQVPEVKIAFTEIEQMLSERLKLLGELKWRVISHSHNIENGILVVSVMLAARELVDEL
jgi:hypothetical protein